VGSARMARCWGATVAQPDRARERHRRSGAPRRRPPSPLLALRTSRFMFGALEIHAQAAGVRLRVLVGLGGEEREVGGLDAHEDAIAQSEEDAPSSPGEIEIFALE